MKSALVVLSGGQDSTTALYWALQRFDKIHTITFDYGQRHKIEVQSAHKILAMCAEFAEKNKPNWEPGTSELIVLDDALRGTSPLTDKSAEVEQYKDTASLPGGIEKTFVPARNILFMTIAANRAVVLGADTIVLGLCQEDYGGYPDCRASFVQAMELAINMGIYGVEDKPTSAGLKFECPLMHLTKSQSVKLAKTLPGCWEALAYSHTCYNGQYPPNPHNHASLLRAKGFHVAGESDPLILRAIADGLLPADYPGDGLVEGTKFATV